MKIKIIYPVLILTLAMSFIITYGISEGKFKTYAFAEIFEKSAEVEESEAYEETKDIDEITARNMEAKLTLKELKYHIERDSLEQETSLEYKNDQYIKETTSRGGFRFNNAMDMVATAYDLSYESCGKYPDDPYYGITASGTKAQPGTVAVDPDVIPLGTKLYIASTDGSPDYGFATALDTGSAIKGYRIDLFMENNQDAMDYGRRQVKVYILD